MDGFLSTCLSRSSSPRGLRFRWCLRFSWFELIIPALELVACVLSSSGWVLPAGVDVLVCLCGDVAVLNPFCKGLWRIATLWLSVGIRLGLVIVGVLGFWFDWCRVGGCSGSLSRAVFG